MVIGTEPVRPSTMRMIEDGPWPRGMKSITATLPCLVSNTVSRIIVQSR
jgi:hypothetical protein